MSDILQKKPPALWSWRELSQGLTAQSTDGPAIYGVGVDSRQIVPGDLFIALPGDPGPRFNPSYRSDVDGHDFIEAAAQNGAVGALVHKPREQISVPADFPLLHVTDTYDGLWALGDLARQRLSGQIVAVTGSSGKTTAKHFLTAALNAYAPPGSFNNHIGVPLALANAPKDSPACVFEIGTNHPGEIGPLAKMVKPDLAILLNVHRAHIENFANAQALREEKVSIFNALKSKTNAISEDLLNLGYGATFGETAEADARVIAIDGAIAHIELYGHKFSVNVPGGGMHRAKTVAATLLACHLLGRDLTPACNLPEALVPRGRGNLVQTGDICVIDDSYNANPDSMRAGILDLLAKPAPQKIAILGEMLELGEASADAHMALAPLLKSVDVVFCVGQGTRALAEHLQKPWFAQADRELIEQVIAQTAPEAVILVKGSNRVFWANQFVDELLKQLDSI